MNLPHVSHVVTINPSPSLITISYTPMPRRNTLYLKDFIIYIPNVHLTTKAISDCAVHFAEVPT